MAKSTKSGFVIKLSNETVQKLTDEDEQAKVKDVKEAAQNISQAIDERDESNSVRNNIETSMSNGTQKHAISVNTSKKKPQDDAQRTLKESVKNLSDDKPGNKDEQGSAATESKSSAEASWGDYAPYVTYEDEEAIYTDPSTQQKYSWNKETNSWAAKESSETPSREYSYENDTHIYTESDGSKFFWDEAKKAWIPKVDDDFLAFYQMSYGFVDNTSKDVDESTKKKEKEKKTEQLAGLKRKNDPQWFDASEETNTKVYVSNLPLDLTEEEFVDFMQKCGLVERDPKNQKMKVKLYTDKEQNCFKGDALCTYIKIESVDLALKLLDGGDLKGNKVKVERAHFQLKGEYNPALKPKKKKKKELEKLKKMQQKLFDWRPEKFVGERSKHERIVIVKNLFHPTDFDNDVQLILDYQQDLREECSKCGEVRKVVIYDRHPEGVAQITMKEPEEADAVVALINGRWFGKKQITAEIYDGRTKYRIAETEADLSKRVEKWDKFLEDKEGVAENKNVDQKPQSETESTSKATTEMKVEKSSNKEDASQAIDL